MVDNEMQKSIAARQNPAVAGQVQHDNKQVKKTTDRQYYLFALRIIGDFGATIAVPVVIFVLIGQWLDGKYDRGPWFTILAFVLAALASGKIIHKKAKTYGQEYQKMVDNDKK